MLELPWLLVVANEWIRGGEFANANGPWHSTLVGHRGDRLIHPTVVL